MTKDRLGGTGRFPRGMLNADDEGELKMAVSREGGNVRLDFGKQVAWIAMEPATAIQLAQNLLKMAGVKSQ